MNDCNKNKHINNSIQLDITTLPKLLQNTIKEMEKYDNENEWVMYDGLSEGLESFAKSALLANKISNSQYDLIIKKYIE